MQLTGIADQFEALGLNIAVMTYDPVELLKQVVEDQDIGFVLLHDEQLAHVNALGIRNQDYQPGQRAYGVPYPGILLVDANGVIRYKFAEPDYRQRPDFGAVLEAARNMP